MNVQDLLDQMFSAVGNPDSTRRDYIVQQYLNHLNTVQEEVAATCSPFLYTLVRQGSITPSASPVPAGTLYTYTAPADGAGGEYYLDDWAMRILAIYTQGETMHKVDMRSRAQALYQGLFSTAFQPVSSGPFECCLAHYSRVARASGIAGALTGATAAEGSKTVTLGASANPLTGGGYTNWMLRLNGEAADYRIVSIDVTGFIITVDRKIRSRMNQSQGTSGAGSGYAAATCRWEVSPPGRLKLKILPTPNATGDALLYDYFAHPRKLLNSDETSELPENFHHLLWKGAMRFVAADKQNDPAYQKWATEYADGLLLLRKADQAETASNDGPSFSSLYDQNSDPQYPGQYIRGGGRYGSRY